MLRKAILLVPLFVASAHAQTIPPEVQQLRMAAQCVQVYEKYVDSLAKELQAKDTQIAYLINKCGDACKEPAKP